MEQIKDIMKSAVSRLALRAADMDHLELEEFKETCDGIKDLAEAGYYCAITEAMEKPENQYGVNYDEHGKFYTPMRSTSPGRYMSRRGYDEVYDPMMRSDMEKYRDIDRNDGRMYYTDMESMRGSSRYDMAKRGYEEAKEKDPHADNTAEMKRIFDELKADMNKLKPKMTPTEKANARNQFNDLANIMMG